jgi:hypothetical protein
MEAMRLDYWVISVYFVKRTAIAKCTDRITTTFIGYVYQGELAISTDTVRYGQLGGYGDAIQHFQWFLTIFALTFTGIFTEFSLL